MKNQFLFVLHYAILILFIVVFVIVTSVKGIKNETTFIVFCSMFCIAHPFVYLILGTYKEYKYPTYNLPRFSIGCMAVTCFFGVLTLYVFFKLGNNGFDTYWWLYEGISLACLILPMIIFYIVDKVKPKKENKGPRFIRNR